jgi:hypothetical protein
MRPETKVFVQALRRGRTLEQALMEYCWAKSSLPIRLDDLEKFGDPLKSPIDWGHCFAGDFAWDAFEGGEDDEQIAARFEEGLKHDCEVGKIRFRPMQNNERPSFGDLVRAMDVEEMLLTAKFFGLKQVAEAVAGKR